MAQEMPVKDRPTLDEEIQARVNRAPAPDVVIAKVRRLLAPAGGVQE
ncbi:hypothetical protein ACQEV2_11845 [Streptomyces sp. CA-251387]